MVTAATLHDIGYAHEATGFHALDGAAFLQAEGFSPLVCHLVAHHSCSHLEAEVRGLSPGVFDPYGFDEDVELLHRLICWADMTTGPEGDTVTVEERLQEIQRRYGPDHVVSSFIVRATPQLLRETHAVISGSM
jgi:hypothetical protein